MRYLLYCKRHTFPMWLPIGLLGSFASCAAKTCAQVRQNHSCTKQRAITSTDAIADAIADAYRQRWRARRAALGDIARRHGWGVLHHLTDSPPETALLNLYTHLTETVR